MPRNTKWWFWLDTKLTRKEQDKLKHDIRQRLSTMDKRKCIPKPRVRYKLKTVIVWRRKPVEYYQTIWK